MFQRARVWFVLGLLCALVFPCAARAGTTGGLSGTVVNAGSSTPVAGARVTVTSPSQSATVQTDASGHFAFISLTPDTYTLSAEKQGFDPISLGGVSVFADQTQTLTVSLQKALREIGRVTARSSADLVKPGTTADVYSVNAAQQDRVAALGGGGSLNSAYSAIATVPGAYVPPNQSGYFQTVHIRGGDSDQVGYEFDGIPVNRAFDNYPSASASSLGQLELQVYTGASPANAEAQGLAGFINQVIKSGTYPGFAKASFEVGGPTFYHSINVEGGGANQQRTFSYYFGLGGFNQDYRYIDQFSGAAYANDFGPILNNCPNRARAIIPSCFTDGQRNVGQAGAPGYILGPNAFGNLTSNLAIRTSVVNLHFGIPHHDGLKDDIQLLYDNEELFSTIFSSANDAGIANLAHQFPFYLDSWQYTGKLGSFLPSDPASQRALVVPYLYPSSPTNRPLDAPIPLDDRDRGYNSQAIVKLQYQKNFSPTAYLRLYGYTYYSDYIGNGANSSFQPYTGFDSGDYELSSHTRGVSATFADQLSSKHLLEVQGSYTTSHALRMYNEQMFGLGDFFAVLVNPNDLTSGICYQTPKQGGTAALPTTCADGGGAALNPRFAPTFASLTAIGTGGSAPPVNGITCGGSPCAFYVAENGQYGEYNQVKPIFTGYSITDQFKPNDRLLINLGLRLDQFVYQGADTTGGASRAFWFNAFNKDTCLDTQGQQLIDKTLLRNASTGGRLAITQPCSDAGAQFQPVNLANTSAQQFTYSVFQPRLGTTYTLSPDTVLRASYGKYTEQPSTAYVQYGALQQNLPDLLGPEFYSYGFTTPGHAVRPSISYNTDLSLEHRFHGTNLSFKLTPFYRQTKDQVENFYLNVKSGLVSGLNIGKQTSRGFEFEFNAGDFERNGLAAQLSFAYTNSYVNYATLSNGTTVVSPINSDIQTYNAYTAACNPASGPKPSLCGSTTYVRSGTSGPPSGSAAACFTPSGMPDPSCGAGAIANPYWNAKPQPLLDPSANYLPYTIFPATIGTGDNAFIFPYVATLVFNYKHDRFSITPSLQFQAGNRYGAPETMPGIDPAGGCSPLAGAHVSGDPRYPYGAPAGAPYDATTCLGQLNAIPDSFTGNFDAIGAFREPAQLLGHLRIAYEASKHTEVVLTLANVINHCFGGQQTSFTYLLTPRVCNYGGLVNGIAPVGNVYNPGDNVQRFLRYPYEPDFGSYNDNGNSTIAPFAAYVSVRVKL